MWILSHAPFIKNTPQNHNVAMITIGDCGDCLPHAVDEMLRYLLYWRQQSAPLALSVPFDMCTQPVDIPTILLLRAMPLPQSMTTCWCSCAKVWRWFTNLRKVGVTVQLLICVHSKHNQIRMLTFKEQAAYVCAYQDYGSSHDKGIQWMIVSTHWQQIEFLSQLLKDINGHSGWSKNWALHK